MFFLGFMVLLWVYVFPVGIKLDRMTEERSASHKGPGRSCGGKILFSPPLPVDLAWGSWRGAYGKEWVMETDKAIGSIYIPNALE